MCITTPLTSKDLDTSVSISKFQSTILVSMKESVKELKIQSFFPTG